MAQIAEIRRLGKNDAEAVAALEKACFTDPWSVSVIEAAFSSDYSELWGLFQEGRDGPSGYYCIGSVLEQGDLMSICVLPEFQGRGFGRLLLRHALERFAALGVEQVFLEVRVGNDAAKGLYRSEGFCDVGTRRHYYPDGEDAIVMMKETD